LGIVLLGVIMAEEKYAPRPWTEEEAQKLKELYPKLPGREVARILNRTTRSVQGKARRLGLCKRKVTHVHWTEDEISFLRESWRTLPKYEIMRRLHRHTWYGIRHMANKLGLRRGFEAIYPPHPLILTEGEKGYLAGLLDGEGSIYIDTEAKYHTVVISFYNNSREVMEYLKKLLPFGHLKVVRRRKRNPRHSNGYRFGISCMTDCHRLLKTLLPYLIIKRKRAIEALKYLEERIRHIPAQRRYIIEGLW